MANYIPDAAFDRIVARLRGNDAVIAAVAVSTGYRIDDVIHLRAWQLRCDQLTVRERKTGNVRSVQLPPAVRDMYNACAGDRHPFRYAFDSSHRDARHVHRSTFWRHFVAAAADAGYAGMGYTPHSLRKIYAVRLIRAGFSVFDVQRDLGHRHVSTTLIYALSDHLG